MRARVALLSAAMMSFAETYACLGSDPDFYERPTNDGGASGDASPAGPNDATNADAKEDDAGPRCNPDAPFSSPVLVEGIGTADHELSASLSNDELTMYFSRRALDAGDNAELYVTTRMNDDEAFGPATLLAVVNSPFEDDNVTTTHDALTVYFHSRAGVDGGRLPAPDIYRATRPSLTTGLGKPAPVEINTDAFDGDPFISADGKTLYFTSTRTGPFRIFRSEVNAVGGFDTALEMTDLYAVDAGQRDIGQPVVSPNGLSIYFASGAVGDFDVWVATRGSTLGAFTNLRPVENVNLPGVNDVPSWISADGCRLVFRSNRSGGAGGDDMWIAKRGF